MLPLGTPKRVRFWEPKGARVGVLLLLLGPLNVLSSNRTRSAYGNQMGTDKKPVAYRAFMRKVTLVV